MCQEKTLSLPSLPELELCAQAIKVDFNVSHVISVKVLSSLRTQVKQSMYDFEDTKTPADRGTNHVVLRHSVF